MRTIISRLFVTFQFIFCVGVLTAQNVFIKKNSSHSNWIDNVIPTDNNKLAFINVELNNNGSPIRKAVNKLYSVNPIGFVLEDSLTGDGYTSFMQAIYYNSSYYNFETKLYDSINDRFNLSLRKYDTNFNLQATLDIGHQYVNSYYDYLTQDNQGNLVALVSHITNGVFHPVLYKIDTSLNILSTNDTIFKLTNPDVNNSILFHNNKMHSFGPMIDTPVGVLNSFMSQYNEFNLNQINQKSYNIDSIGYYTNGFSSQLIEIMYYFDAEYVSDNKFIIATNCRMERSTSFSTFRSDFDVITFLYNPITNQVSNTKQFDYADTNDVSPSGKFLVKFNDHLFLTSTINYKLEVPDFYYRNRNSQVLLVKLDTNNTVIWERRFGGDANYYVTSMCVTPDSSILITGSVYDSLNMPSPYTLDGFIMKFDLEGNPQSIGTKEIEKTKIDFITYPNPSHDIIKFKTNIGQIKKFELYDALGREVSRIEGLAEKEFNYQTDKLISGSYFYKIYLSNNSTPIFGQIIKN